MSWFGEKKQMSLKCIFVGKVFMILTIVKSRCWKSNCVLSTALAVSSILTFYCVVSLCCWSIFSAIWIFLTFPLHPESYIQSVFHITYHSHITLYKTKWKCVYREARKSYSALFPGCGLSAVLKCSPLSMTGWLTKTEYACWVFIKEKATTNLPDADAETLEVL